MTSYFVKLGLLGLVVALMLAGTWVGQPVYAQAPPPLPTQTPGAAIPPTFSGLMILLLKITVTDGSEVPDGLLVFARIGNEYETERVATENGTAFVKIVPGNPALVGRSVVVWIDTVPIDQELVYSPGANNLNFLVTIPNLPIPTATPTRVPVRPAVYSGTVTIAGARVQSGMELVARVGDYESFPANLEGAEFTGLVIITTDESLVGHSDLTDRVEADVPVGWRHLERNVNRITPRVGWQGMSALQQPLVLIRQLLERPDHL